MSRVLAVWLDGFDIGLAERLELPMLDRLRRSGLTVALDNGTAHLTGLTGEHLASGLDPDSAGRHAAVHFDPASYAAWQDGATVNPVLDGVPTVVLDPCYFSLDATSALVEGVVDWGAHDPGTARGDRPCGLMQEVLDTVGEYPARDFLYASPWPDTERCAEMSRALAQAVTARSELASWLLGERLPNWQFAFVGVSEAHSAAEGLWHGVDANHPAHHVPSARTAAAGLGEVYRHISVLVERLLDQFPDAIHVVFTMHGMGPNLSDTASMALLPELLHRWSGETPRNLAFETDDHGLATLDGHRWTDAVRDRLAPPSGLHQFARRLPAPLRRSARRARARVSSTPDPGAGAVPTGAHSLDWMPLLADQRRWYRMRAFAIPSFYDGRIRVNLAGRESRGIVELADYDSTLGELESILRDCHELRTGRPVVSRIHRPVRSPLHAGPTESDLVVEWSEVVLGLRHPTLGDIGPVPPRRTGGHASPVGRAWIVGEHIPAEDLGETRSSFDITPTLLALAGIDVGGLSGQAIDWSHRPVP